MIRPQVNASVRRRGSHSTSLNSRTVDDPHDLNRFVQAQENDYEQAFSEIVGGRKRTHWMWYIFPQIDGLAFSSTSKRFAIKRVEEAKAYLDHPVLGPRLLKCAEAVVGVEGRSATEIFGSPDDLKLRSSATLFASVLPVGSVFDRLLAKYYAGVRDGKTLHLLEIAREVGGTDRQAREMRAAGSLSQGTAAEHRTQQSAALLYARFARLI